MTVTPHRTTLAVVLATLGGAASLQAQARQAAAGPEGDRMTFKPPEDAGYLAHPLAIMDRRTHEAYSFDPRTDRRARISYTVSKSGSVRIRLVLRENKALLLRTLQDWRPSRYGPEYVTEWDGRDASGRLLDNRRVFVLFEANDQKGAKTHGGHAVEACRDPALKIVSPLDGSTVRGLTTVTVAFPGGSPTMPASSAYVGRLYVDDVPAAQQRFDARLPGRTFTFDPTRLSPGRHVLIVNLDDLNDHIGTASASILVEP